MASGVSGYAAISTKVRAMYADLLTPQDMTRLSDSPDLPALISALKSTPYGKYLSGLKDNELTSRRVILQVRHRLADSYSSVVQQAPEQTRPLVRQLFRYFEVGNLKAVLRSIQTVSSWRSADPPSTLSRAVWEDKPPLAAEHDLMLVIAGEGEPGYVASLHKLARELGLGEQVLWAGQIGGDVKTGALTAAKVFVLPSYSENFGIAVAEALLAGLPCVLGRGVAIAGEVTEAGAGLAVAPVPRAIAEALRSILDDDKRRAVMGRRATALATERYSLEAMGRGLKDLYSRILSDKSSGHIE